MAKRAPNPEYQRKYYLEHRDKRIADAGDWQRENAAARREYNAAYYAANKSKIAEQVKGYRERTKEERSAKRKAEYSADPERFKRDTKAWQAANPRKRLDQRMRKYGINADEYDRMLAEQDGGCAICKRTDSGDKRGGRFHVDHCHNSTAVRGLLCSGCNMGIGKFADDPDRLERAAVYLRARLRAPGADK